MTRLATPIFDHAHLKNFQSPFCVNFCQFIKYQSIPPAVHSEGTVNFTVPRSDWPYRFLTMPNQKMFVQLLFFVNL